MTMGLETAYRVAKEDMAQLNPAVAASMSGASFDKGRFTIPFFNRRFSISFPGLEAAELGSDAPPPKVLEILLMHYLVNADGTPPAGTWITYRQLPGANLFEQRFANLVTRPMLQRFGHDAEGLRRAAAAIGGQPMHRSGDVAFRFMALPRIPVGCVLYVGDEEMASSISILFDANAPQYLPTEDLTIVASFLNSALAAQERASGDREVK